MSQHSDDLLEQIIVNTAGSSAGTEYTEGATDATFTGPVVQGEGPSNTVTPIQIDASGNLKVVGSFTISENLLDYDTGAGTDSQSIMGIALPANGGAVAGGTSTNPIRTDPTGTTTQPTSIPAIVITATVSSVNDTASSTQLLASNAVRKGYKLFNASTVTAYVKEGTTATTSDYSYQILAGGYYEFCGIGVYTGRIDCIWASDASGAMKITEVS